VRTLISAPFFVFNPWVRAAEPVEKKLQHSPIMPDSEPATPFIPPRPDIGTPLGNSPGVLPSVIPMSPSQVSVAPQIGHIQCSPPINTASVFELISSRRERVLLSLHRHTLYPASHGSPWFLLHAHHSITGKCWTSTFPSSTGSWVPTPPSWCICRVDRSSDWTPANRICDPL
jgi:hypothetical protein